MKSLICASFMFCFSSFSLAYDWSTNPGDGSPENPYQIWMSEQMNAIGENDDLWGKHFKLTADIDMSEYTGNQYNIIGDGSTAFGGMFDGDGHIISNLSYTNDSAPTYLNVGLFGRTDSTAVIKNIQLKNVHISSSGRYTGGLIGDNHGSVQDCHVEGSVTGPGVIGGLIGKNSRETAPLPYLYPDTSIRNCSARCEVLSTNSSNNGRCVGGLIGQNSTNNILFCCAGGTVTGQATSTDDDTHIGGLIGYNRSGKIKFCRFNGAVESGGIGNAYVGGLVGKNGDIDDGWGGRLYPGGSIIDCHASGQIHGGDYAGGLVGYNIAAAIRNSDSSGQIKGNNYIGGLIGYSLLSDIHRCSANGTVFGAEHAGGLIGYVNDNSVKKSYANSYVIGNKNIGGLVGSVGINSSTFMNCCSTGAVDGKLSNVGGLIGNANSYALIENCYSAGPVSGTATSIGGFIGVNEGVLISCFWDTDTSGFNVGVGNGSAVGVAGLPTTIMQTVSTFIDADWDFTSEDGNSAVWEMLENNYPTFLWQPLPGSAAYSGGDGSEENPYQITTISDFLQLTNTPGDWSRHFILTASLDLEGTVFTESPIAPDKDRLGGGFQGTSFSGSFEGNGHMISHLQVDANELSYIGLFGQIRGGRIANLKLEDVDVYGQSRVGALAGTISYGTIVNCQITGSIGGKEYVGGAAGYNIQGTITSCESGCSVNGSSSVGGITGENGGTIERCRATGAVTLSGISTYSYGGGLTGCNAGDIISSCSTAPVIADGNAITIGGITGVNYAGDITSVYSMGTVTSESPFSNYAGGFAGYLAGGSANYSYSTGIVTAGGQSGQLGGFIGEAVPIPDSVTSCFWDIESSGLTYSSGGKAVNSRLIKSQIVFQNAGWASKGWVIQADEDSPRLIWQGTPGSLIPPAENFLTGSGTEADPYLIYTDEEFAFLSWHADILDKHLKLMKDLDLSCVPVFPIGDLGTFTGVFDGNGHTLSNIRIYQPGSDYVGVFSKIGIQPAGPLHPIRKRWVINLKLENIDIVGNDYVGGLVGYSFDGRIQNCSCSGSIQATGQYAGGLAGIGAASWRLPSSGIFTSYAACSVDGTSHVGGLIGSSNCYIFHCYAAGPVVGAESPAGGFIGKNVLSPYHYQAPSGFWDIETSGQANGVGEGSSGGITGKNTIEMMTLATFTEAGWDFVGEEENGTRDYWRMCTDCVDYPRLRIEYLRAGDFACGDGVGLEDLEAISLSWLLSYPDSEIATDYDGDANGDGEINLEDFEILSGNWQQ